MYRVALALTLALATITTGCRPAASTDQTATPGSGSGEPANAATAGSAVAAFVPEFNAADAEKGAELWTTYCALCHGPNGEGYAADNANQLNNPVFLSLASDEFIRQGIAHGRPGSPMSAWHLRAGGPLSDDGINQLVAHIRSWQTQPPIPFDLQPIPGSPSEGKVAYDQHCASCHGPEGTGGTGPRIANPAFLATASDPFLYHSIRLGRPGTPMPAFEGTVPEGSIRDIVAYLRSLQAPFEGVVQEQFKADYSRAVINPEGTPATFTLREDRFVAADDVKAALDAGQALVIIDARAASDYLVQHIAGSVSVPYYDLERAAAELPRDRFIIAYCGCPHAASGRAIDSLREAGFTQLAVLDEGFYVWRDRGYPLNQGDPANPGTTPILPPEALDPHAGHNHGPIGSQPAPGHDPHAGHNHP